MSATTHAGMRESERGRNRCVAGLYMFALTFKATVGTGILAIPYVVQRFGMVGAIVGLAAFAAFSWYTMRTLLACVNVIATKPTLKKQDIHGFEMPFEQPLMPVGESRATGMCVKGKLELCS